MRGKKIAFPVPFLIAATILIIAGGLISAINSAAPFDRGSWLAAYLVLVGGVAQVTLAGGRLAIVSKAPSPREEVRLLALWNFGSLAVPLGVLADLGLAIWLGSAALLAGLWLFTRGIDTAGAAARASRARPGAGTGTVIGYLGFAVMLAVSVAIGCLLADAPLLG